MEKYSWSDLPADLLHLVYSKVVCLHQRVRFAAVCTSWRDAATVRRHAAPPAALPLHISSFGGNRDRSKRLYCPQDGEVMEIRIPSVAVVKRFVGAHDGGWVAALTRKHVKLVVVNLFSGAEVPLSVKQRKFVPTRYRDDDDGPCEIKKIVFSEAPTSSDCILAALTCSSRVALCKVGCGCLEDDEGWIMARERSRFADIAFCNRKLYGVTTNTELFRFDITANKDVVVTRLLSVPHRAPTAMEYILFDLGNSDSRGS